jgi:hypothetical protein
MSLLPVTRERQTHTPARARKLGLLALGAGAVLLAGVSVSSTANTFTTGVR